MKKWKIAIITILVIGIIAFAAYIVFLIIHIDDDSIIPGSLVAYHSKEELSELYWQNKDLLNVVKESVLSSKPFLHALDDYGEGDFDISYQGDKKYFTDEERADIVSVFEILHPNMIMMERKGRPLIFYITFRSLKQGELIRSTYLYWFPNEEERIYHEEPGVFPDGEFTQIDEGWYIVEQTDSR